MYGGLKEFLPRKGSRKEPAVSQWELMFPKYPSTGLQPAQDVKM